MVRESSLSFALSALVSLLLTLCLAYGADSLETERDGPPHLIKPAISTQSGLLLEPPLDLADFTKEEFLSISSTVGAEKIRKAWNSPVTALPPHARPEVKGLTQDEVKAYMIQVRQLFDAGKSVPVSDVGLISTQEDVIRRPMFNHVAAFSNSVVRVYLLVQRTARDKEWGYFSIVQDLTVEPVLDYYAQIFDSRVKFEGASCYKCHSSGPLAIHPVREDLVSDPQLAAAISKHIADQPRSRMHMPEGVKPADPGKPLELKFCTKCHDTDGDRASLFQIHSHPIRVLVDFGYMPPKRRLNADEIAELKAWLDRK